MSDNSASTSVRFDKIDRQLLSMKQEFKGVNGQLERIVTVVVKGFDRIDKTLETKADSADLQKALGLLDTLSKTKRFPTMSVLLWQINLLGFTIGLSKLLNA